jgi:V8-like Glu-specific endopeptidase
MGSFSSIAVIMTGLLLQTEGFRPTRIVVPTQDPSVVYITSESGASCTGFIAKKDYVITARHCLRPKMRVEFSDSEAKEAEPYKQGEIKGDENGDDWLILKTETGNREPLAIDMSGKQPNFPVYTIYITYRDKRQAAAPIKLTSSDLDDAKKNQLHFEGAIRPGDSGSPIIGEKEAVIGIVVATIPQMQLGFASPAANWPPLP